MQELCYRHHSRSAQRGKRCILVVDDIADSAHMLQAFLQTYGHEDLTRRAGSTRSELS